MLQFAVQAKVAIEARQLTKRYGNDSTRPPAVDTLDLTVLAGDRFGFLGENGAGKTTTIKMLTGLIPPTSGTAHITGFNVQESPLEAKRRFGYIPDNPNLYDKLTGYEFLHFIADLYGLPPGSERETRMADLLTLLDLTEQANRSLGGYSRGMRQKIALVSALLYRPEVLFLDEPTVGLDPTGIRRLQDILRAVADSGVAVFLSTHALSVAQGLCNRIGILHRGKLVALGTPDELTENGTRPLEEVFLAVTEATETTQNEIARILTGKETTL